MLAIGVDVGGSKPSVGVVDTADGRVVERLEIVTPPVEETGDAFLNEVAEATRGLATGSVYAGKRSLLLRAIPVEPLPH